MSVNPIALFSAIAVTSIIAVGATRSFARWSRLVDRPNAITGSLCGESTLGGGIAVIGISLVAILLVSGATPLVIRLAAVVGAACLLGLIDDFVSLPPWLKVAGLCVVVSFYLFQLELPLPALLLVGGFLVLTPNAWNVVDVMDGLLGTIGLICFLGMSVVMTLHGAGDQGLQTITLAVAGALVGFLFWNRHPASVLLGDSGSLALGMLYGVVVVECGLSDRRLALVLIIPGAIPLFEACLLIIERTRKHVLFYTKTTDHFALRLKRMGFSTNRIQFIAAVFGIALAAAAVLIELSSFHIVVITGTTCVIAAAFLISYLWLIRIATAESKR